MFDTSCSSYQDVNDGLASLRVSLQQDANMAVKQMSDKGLIQWHDRCNREHGRTLHDRRIMRNRDRNICQLQAELAVYKEEILRRFRMRVYIPSGMPYIRRQSDAANVVQLPIRREQEAIE